MKNGLFTNTDNRFMWLDLVRGLAALAVFTGHLRTLMFKSFTIEDSGFVKKIFFYLTGFGHQAVVIFFVLSGFFISKNISNSITNSKWSLGGYAIDRLVRLWIVLIPALLITFLVDRVGLSIFSDSMGYEGKIPYLAGVQPLQNSTVTIFFGNLFFFQTIYFPTLGSNAALWSLCNEFWYYILFPLLFFLYRIPTLSLKLILLVCSLAIFYLIGAGASLYFLIWLLGYVIVLLSGVLKFKEGRMRIATAFALLFFLVIMHLTRIDFNERIANDFTLGFATAIFMLCLNYQKMNNKVLQYVSIFLSEISYSLYLIHLPLSLFFSCWLVKNPMNWNVQGFILYLFVFVLNLGITTLFWFLFESRYKPVRFWIKSKLNIIKMT